MYLTKVMSMGSHTELGTIWTEQRTSRCISLWCCAARYHSHTYLIWLNIWYKWDCNINVNKLIFLYIAKWLFSRLQSSSTHYVFLSYVGVSIGANLVYNDYWKKLILPFRPLKSKVWAMSYIILGILELCLAITEYFAWHPKMYVIAFLQKIGISWSHFSGKDWMWLWNTTKLDLRYITHMTLIFNCSLIILFIS